MSVEFTLTDCNLDCEQWNGLLNDWAKEQPDDLYDDPAFDADDNEPVILVWGQGSTRGVMLGLGKKGREVTVRFTVLSSRRDWERGFEIMRRALAQGTGTVRRETGETYTDAELTREKAHQEAVTDFLVGAKSTSATINRTDEKKILLPFGGFALPVTAADLPECTLENQAAIEEALALRVEKYGRAYRGNVFELPTKAYVTTWSLIPTIVSKVDYVALDWNGICIPRNRLVEILGERVEPLGDAYYLPQLDREKDRALLDALAQENVDPKTAQPCKAPERSPEDTQAAEMQLIKKLTLILMTQMLERNDPHDARKAMCNVGVDPEVADSLIAAVALSLRAMAEDKKNPKAVIQSLVEKGLPLHMATAIVDGIAEFMADESDEEETEEE